MNRSYKLFLLIVKICSKLSYDRASTGKYHIKWIADAHTLSHHALQSLTHVTIIPVPVLIVSVRVINYINDKNVVSATPPQVRVRMVGVVTDKLIHKIPLTYRFMGG